jgi:hypothetical protein
VAREEECPHEWGAWQPERPLHGLGRQAYPTKGTTERLAVSSLFLQA